MDEKKRGKIYILFDKNENISNAKQYVCTNKNLLQQIDEMKVEFFIKEQELKDIIISKEKKIKNMKSKNEILENEVEMNKILRDEILKHQEVERNLSQKIVSFEEEIKKLNHEKTLHIQNRDEIIESLKRKLAQYQDEQKLKNEELLEKLQTTTTELEKVVNEKKNLEQYIDCIDLEIEELSIEKEDLLEKISILENSKSSEAQKIADLKSQAEINLKVKNEQEKEIEKLKFRLFIERRILKILKKDAHIITIEGVDFIEKILSSNEEVLEYLAYPKKGVTPLWHYKKKGSFYWTPDKINWMKAPTLIVSDGIWKGQKPVEENILIITFLGNISQ